MGSSGYYVPAFLRTEYREKGAEILTRLLGLTTVGFGIVNNWLWANPPIWDLECF